LAMDGQLLLRGEGVLRTKLANAIIRRSDYDLAEFGHSDRLLALVGLAGAEGIGGKLYLTNYRLVFVSHAINRVTGTFSIFLSTIKQIQGDARVLKKRISVATGTSSFEFIAWGIPPFLRAVEGAKAKLTDSEVEGVREEVKANPEKVGSGLRKSALLGDLDIETILKLSEIVTNPLEAANALNLIELLFPNEKAPG
jgi:GRAM domain